MNVFQFNRDLLLNQWYVRAKLTATKAITSGLLVEAFGRLAIVAQLELVRLRVKNQRELLLARRCGESEDE